MANSRPIWFYQHSATRGTWKEFTPKTLHKVETAYQDYYKRDGESSIQIRIGKRRTKATIDFERMQQTSHRNFVRDIRRVLEPWVGLPMVLHDPPGA